MTTAIDMAVVVMKETTGGMIVARLPDHIMCTTKITVAGLYRQSYMLLPVRRHHLHVESYIPADQE
jgi:hypothetical protein